MNDSIASLSLGVVSRLLQGYLRFLTVAPYQAVHNRLALRRLRVDSLPRWAAALLLVDLGYYLQHRAAHSCNLAWGGHVAHHSSEEFNLSTALRQGLFEGAFAWVYYLPMALFFDYRVYRVATALNLAWQFWVHTRKVGKCPAWVEAVFVTPSHHRVHHGADAKYLDANFGGMLIIWDRLFGTFVPEEEEPRCVAPRRCASGHCCCSLRVPSLPLAVVRSVVADPASGAASDRYGLTPRQLQSWNPLWATVHHFVAVWRRLRRFPRESWRAKLEVLLYGPGWSPKKQRYLEAPPLEDDGKFDPPLPAATKAYAAVQFAAVLYAFYSGAMAALGRRTAGRVASTGAALWSLYSIGALMEARKAPFRPQLEEQCWTRERVRAALLGVVAALRGSGRGFVFCVASFVAARVLGSCGRADAVAACAADALAPRGAAEAAEAGIGAQGGDDGDGGGGGGVGPASDGGGGGGGGGAAAVEHPHTPPRRSGAQEQPGSAASAAHSVREAPTPMTPSSMSAGASSSGSDAGASDSDEEAAGRAGRAVHELVDAGGDVRRARHPSIPDAGGPEARHPHVSEGSVGEARDAPPARVPWRASFRRQASEPAVAPAGQRWAQPAQRLRRTLV